MLRIEALKQIYPHLKDHLVVTIMGAVAVELYSLGHRPNFSQEVCLEHPRHSSGHYSIISIPEVLYTPSHRSDFMTSFEIKV